MKKIVVVGAGIAGCITALHYRYFGSDKFEVEMHYDPETPIEKVGQGTTLPITALIGNSLGINWYDNPVGSTIKTGILYENWGKRHEKLFHEFPKSLVACHYVPKLVSKTVLESGLFQVKERKIQNPEKEIDCDYIFDCRGRKDINYSQYDKVINPLNSAIISRKSGVDHTLKYTRCVATPNGWAFVIPNSDSVSYGYLYNSTITTKEEASNDFRERFGVDELDYLSFKNYIAKNVWYGERTILNGTRYGFIEPLEATSAEFYQTVAKYTWDHIEFGASKKDVNNELRKEAKRIETFILWHYQNGSKFETPFWDYAKSLSFSVDDEFKEMLSFSRQHNQMELSKSEALYSQWAPLCFNNWDSV